MFTERHVRIPEYHKYHKHAAADPSARANSSARAPGRPSLKAPEPAPEACRQEDLHGLYCYYHPLLAACSRAAEASESDRVLRAEGRPPHPALLFHSVTYLREAP